MYEQSQSRGCALTLREEFQSGNITLSHERPVDFCRSQWQMDQCSITWLIYRWILAVFFTSGVTSTLYLYFLGGRWFIYFTSWGFTLCMLACLTGAIIATLHFLDDQFFEPDSRALKIYWFLHTTALVVSLLITLIYWSLVYPSLEVERTLAMTLYGIMAHVCTSVFMLLDHFVVAFPTRIMHFIYPFVFCLAYAHFTYIYYIVGGTDIYGKRYIYALLNWSQPQLALITVVCSLSLVFVISFVLYWLYRFRLWLCQTENGRASIINF